MTPTRATETDGCATHADFATVLKQVPKSTEAKNALDEICLLLRERNNNDLDEPAECGPSLTEPKFELESVLRLE